MAAALTCALLSIDGDAAADQGGACLDIGATQICEALALGMQGLDGDWVRQFDDAGAICYDGHRFGVWCDGRPDWSPECQAFGGICHVLCAAAWSCEVASIEDTEVLPLLNALPELIIRHPEIAVAALETVLNAGQPMAPDRPLPLRALAIGGALLASGAGMALAWPAMPWLAGGLEAAAAGVMLCSVSHGPDPTERIRLAAWFSNLLPELTACQLHRLCDRIQGCDARLNVVVLVAALRRQLRDGMGRSPTDVIDELDVQQMVDEAIARDTEVRPLARFTLGRALEAAVHLLHDAGLLVRSSQEISTRPRAMRVADWYETLDRMDRETPVVLRLSGSVASREMDRLGRAKAGTGAAAVLAPPSKGRPLDTARLSSRAPIPSLQHESPQAWLLRMRRQAAWQAPVKGAGSWQGVSAAEHGTYERVPPAPDDPGQFVQAWLDDAGNQSVSDRLSATPKNASDIPSRISDSKQLDVRASLNLEEIVLMHKWISWDSGVGNVTQFHTYRERAVKYTQQLAQEVYETLPASGGGPGGVDWDARIEVRYQEAGFFPVGGNVGSGLKSRREYSLLQVALGHHFYEESLTVGGSRTVKAVRVVSVNGTDSYERTRTHLSMVNTDAFRAALHAKDVSRISALRVSKEAISAFSQYVRAVVAAMIFRARALGTAAGPTWVAPRGWSASPALLEEQLELQLLTYEGKIVPGLVSLTHAPSGTALLLSIKRQEWYWWSKDVESREDWRAFMKDHLSMREVASLDSALYLTPRYFSIGTVCRPIDRCGQPKPSLYDLSLGIHRFRAPWRTDFAFVRAPDIEAALWAAEVDRMRENLDTQVVTPALRKRRDWDDLRIAMLQSSMVLFPIVGGMFRGAAAAVDWSFRFSYAGATASYLYVQSEKAEYATLRQLEAIHSNQRFGMFMMLINQIPASAPLTKIARAMSGCIGQAGRQIVRPMLTLMHKGAGYGSLREQMAEQTKALRVSPMSATQRKTPWTEIQRLRTRLGISGDTLDMRASQSRGAPISVLHFLGTGAMLVESFDVLTQLPAGYSVAFVTLGDALFFAGVTGGSGTIVGSCTDASVSLLPHHRFDVVDLLGKDHDAIAFLADDLAECDGQLFRIWVESPADALPEMRVSEADLIRVRSQVAGYFFASRQATNGTGDASKIVTRAPRRNLDPFDDPSLPRWDTVVAQWRARPDPAVTTDTPISTAILLAHWTSDFDAALRNVFARVETGLLLWHFLRVPQAQQDLMLARLRDETEVGTLSLDDVDIPGVAALGNAQAFLLVSLTTGEVCWEGGTGIATNAPMRQFLLRHLSDADATRLASVLGDSAPLPSGRAPYEIIFQAPTQDFTELVNRTRAWCSDQLACVGLAGPGCAPVERRHELTYLIEAAASHRPGTDEPVIVNLARRLASPTDRGGSPKAHFLRSAECDDARETPGLPFAHYLGESVTGATQRAFGRDNTTHPTDSLRQRVSNHVIRSQQRFAVHVARRELADLIESGAGNDTFCTAMAAAADALQGGRFDPAFDAVSDDLLPVLSGHVLRHEADVYRRIAGKDDMRQLPPGYRILLTANATNETLDETKTGVHAQMLSLGQGVVAAWCDPGAGVSRSTTYPESPTYTRLDLLSDNSCLNVTDAGATLADGTSVEMWVEPGASDEGFRRVR
ncbi:hypothetical protein DBA20_03280 [Pandoraea capi]|nr:hypothetical protein [Pandoraea sp. LA3]MDN4582009.1 hypothetical protein [Pandoraea capi]